MTDGSTARGNRHYLVVLIQTTEKKRVVTYFYHLIEVPLDETSQGLTTILVNQLKLDGLYKLVQDNIVGFISDGASVMVGVKSGMDKILRYVDHTFYYIELILAYLVIYNLVTIRQDFFGPSSVGQGRNFFTHHCLVREISKLQWFSRMFK